MKRAIWGVGGVIGVVMAALVVALVTTGPTTDEPIATVSASGRDAVGAPAAPVSGATTSSTPTTVAVTVSVPMTTTTTVPTTTPTTVRATTTLPPTTTVPETATTTVPETTTTTGDWRPPGPICAPSMFTTTVTVDKPAYKVGEPVQATATFRNSSGQACYWSSSTGTWKVLDATETQVTNSFTYIADAFRWVAFAAGDTKSMSPTWDQKVCRGDSPCSVATPGRYTFVLSEQPYGEGRAVFDITA